jgi:hypothetical protein
VQGEDRDGDVRRYRGSVTGAPRPPSGSAEPADEPDHDEEPADDAPADGTEPTGPDPLRFNHWMKRSTTGAVLTGVTLGLQRALEERDKRPAFVIEAPGEPEDDDARIHLQFDPDDPSNTVAVVRADTGAHPEPPSPDEQPDDRPDGPAEPGP